MSRIGKQAVVIPSGVEVKLEGVVLKFKKGNLSKELDTKSHVNVTLADNSISFSPKGDDRQSRALSIHRNFRQPHCRRITHGRARVLWRTHMEF